MKKITKIIMPILLLAYNKAFAMCGQAETVDQIANCIYDNFTNLPSLMGAISYVVGIFFMLNAIHRLHETTQNKQANISRISVLSRFLASAFFLALPTLLKIGVGTFGFGNSSNLGGY